MPIPSSPDLLTNVLGYAADLNSIPATTPSGSGAFSYQAGFPAITGFPLTAGGIAPSRQDFNGVFNLIGQHLFFLQSGSLYPWSASLDYLVGAHVLGSDGKEYIAQKSSGPDVPSAPAVNPVGDESGTWLAATLAYGAPLATSSSPGLMQPDGVTCTVKDGVISNALPAFNTRLVITDSNAAWTPPVTGWARVTVIGGGGGGGKGGSQITGGGGRGGGAGGQTSFGEIVAAGGGGGGGGGATGGADVGGSGGGGASGAVITQYVYISTETAVSVVIGAGGAGATNTMGTQGGGDGGGTLGGKGAATSYSPGGGGGVVGGGNGGNAGSFAPFSQAGYLSYPGAAGNGGSNGTGYGGGGGGGSGDVNSNNPTAFLSGIGGDNGSPGGDPDDVNGGNGGDGGQGAVIIEYYDPAKEAHNA